MKSQLKFLGQFFREPSVIGAVWPSSPVLAKKMLAWLDFAQINTIVEFGPGTGVFSKAIQKNISADVVYFAIELNDDVYRRLTATMPDLNVYHDSAANVNQYLQQNQCEHADAIICGLPWAAFPETLQDELLNATLEALPPGGKFATFAYLQGLILPAGLRFRKKLDQHFSSVTISSTIWRNMPPAIVYQCVK